ICGIYGIYDIPLIGSDTGVHRPNVHVCFQRVENGGTRASVRRVKHFPPFHLDSTNQCLWRATENGVRERITLKPKVYSILEYFVNHPGRLVTQQELLEAIWRDTYVQPEVLKRHIFDVREVLGDDPKTPVFL